MKTLGRVKSLNSKSTSPEYVHQEVREASDTYTDAVFAMLALVNETRWNPESREFHGDVRYEIGRRMTTSSSNRVSPSVDVTPDCVIQHAAHSGLVAETKLGLPKDTRAWDEDIIQMQKYDDHLVGWWTTDEDLASHDIVALVPLSRAVKFADRLDAGVKAGDWQFDRPIAVIGFYKQSGVKDFMGLKKEKGELSKRDLNERLRESRQISLSLLIVEYHDRKFVDHPPPLPYLLQIIWDDLFTRYAAEIPTDDSTDILPLNVSVEKTTHDLQEYFGFKSSGPRSPEIPRASWVRKAMDVLVDSKIAKKTGESSYSVRYKRGRGDTLKKFGKLCFQLEQKKRKTSPDQAQLHLGLKSSDVEDPETGDEK